MMLMTMNGLSSCPIIFQFKNSPNFNLTNLLGLARSFSFSRCFIKTFVHYDFSQSEFKENGWIHLILGKKNQLQNSIFLMFTGN